LLLGRVGCLAVVTGWVGVTVIAMALGHITRRADGTYRVYVYAGKDPLTGKQRHLNGTADPARSREGLHAAVGSGRRGTAT
jgi:hypothetical protein